MGGALVAKIDDFLNTNSYIESLRQLLKWFFPSGKFGRRHGWPPVDTAIVSTSASPAHLGGLNREISKSYWFPTPFASHDYCTYSITHILYIWIRHIKEKKKYISEF
jgi:hypothetical protein